MNEAERRFSEFTGHDVEYVTAVEIKNNEVGFKIGMCDGILYSTMRDGKIEHYIHKFKKSAKPILASNYNGTQLFLLKGNYNFTERGIVDK